jgi:hypothetical protein
MLCNGKTRIYIRDKKKKKIPFISWFILYIVYLEKNWHLTDVIKSKNVLVVDEIWLLKSINKYGTVSSIEDKRTS